VVFLDQLARAYPSGEVVLMLVLDTVGPPAAKRVRAWRAEPEHAASACYGCPKYAAHEDNPIERVWGLLKDQVGANRLMGSIDALVTEAERFFITRRFQAPHPLPTPIPSLAQAA
jgi:DDE superfamily endonuclease